ncbi:MAG: hypothetical protein A4E32_00541 [Methanomassiliicoccales archaeon PtaU1.Bin124]|nr:MAG: hypothetical protein A4E32_00541 [Methanomassiliicoccales archaeon PtaU1.Bin124]
MAEESEKKAKRPDGPICDHALVCPEEWEDPEGRKVLSEFHQEEHPVPKTGVEADLERFEEFWASRGSVNVQSKYHKSGAPYAEHLEGDEERPVSAEVGAATAGVEPEGQKAAPGEEAAPQSPFSGRNIDLATLELLSYALMRAAFGKGLHIPLKKEGMIDADLTVRGKDVIINTNQLYASIPDLAVWRIVYTHQGRTILEFGRDVPNGMRIYRLNAIKLAMIVWKQTRDAKKAKARLMKRHKKYPESVSER